MSLSDEPHFALENNELLRLPTPTTSSTCNHLNPSKNLSDNKVHGIRHRRSSSSTTTSSSNTPTESGPPRKQRRLDSPPTTSEAQHSSSMYCSIKHELPQLYENRNTTTEFDKICEPDGDPLDAYTIASTERYEKTKVSKIVIHKRNVLRQYDSEPYEVSIPRDDYFTFGMDCRYSTAVAIVSYKSKASDHFFYYSDITHTTSCRELTLKGNFRPRTFIKIIENFDKVIHFNVVEVATPNDNFFLKVVSAFPKFIYDFSFTATKSSLLYNLYLLTCQNRQFKRITVHTSDVPSGDELVHIVSNVAAAPVVKIQSTFRQRKMPINSLLHSLTSIIKSPTFWSYGKEIVIEGHYNAEELYGFLQNLPNTINGITMLNYTVNGSFSIDSILSNPAMKTLQKLCFNCRSTCFSDFTANLNAVLKSCNNINELLLLTTGFTTDERKLRWIPQQFEHNKNVTDIAGAPYKPYRLQILSSEKIDDYIFKLLTRNNFQYTGRDIRPQPAGGAETYETFTIFSNPDISLAFQSTR
uniref:Uncharacterized protein n=1 Tax=Panagrolaimus sp. ES5 TaxID=591445 RepID=A0AC34F4P5_9BILA